MTVAVKTGNVCVMTPTEIPADSGHILIESAGTYLDMRGLDVLRAVLRTAEVVAAQQRADMTEDGK